ncbi:rhomboid family protein [Seiridium cupressi]
MNILSSLAPPSSFHIGIRAICRHSERTLCAAAVRQLSPATATSSESCRTYSSLGRLGLSRPLRHNPLRHEQLLPRTAIRTIFKFRAIVHYSQLPNDYEDGKGLPFRKEDLNRTEVKQVFGPHITPTNANALLRIIHGRRVAGTLDDPDLQQNTATFHGADKIKALEYLRTYVPVDEVLNAGLRAEDELRLLEEQVKDDEQMEQQDKETILLKTSPPPPKELTEEGPEDQPKTLTGRLPQQKDSSPYGESVFDRIRKRNEALSAERKKREEEERIKREEEEARQNIGGLQKEMAQPKAMSPWRQKYAERATSNLTAPPEMKAWERLLPATTFTLLVLAACVVLAAYYTPVKRERRMWPDIPPAAATCIALMLVNTAIFALWKFPPAWSILNRYMIVVPATPRPLQLIGALFSHQSFTHLAGNMIALWFFGIRLHDEIGRGNFLALYFASGTVGFLASMFNLVLWRGIQHTSLGASGAIYGIVTAFFWTHRKDEFKVFGYPPDPLSGPTGAVFLGSLVGLHIWAGLFSSSAAAMILDVASHFGGIAAGLLGIELVQKHMGERSRTRAEREKELSKTVNVMNKVMESRPNGGKQS